MNINLNQLRAFHEVAKSLSFSTAAKNLYVTQPAVTKQVKLFQESFNLKLFGKFRGKIYLTDEGKKVFTYASKIFELEQQLVDMIQGMQNLKKGSLRIGVTKTYAKYLMPVLLSPFQETYPDIIIELDEGSSQSMTESLLDFRNSLAIVAKIVDNPDVAFIPFMTEEVVFIAASDHHLARKDEVSLDDALQEPIVMKEIGSGTRKIVEETARGMRKKLNIFAQTSNMDFIIQLVKRKQACAFVVKSAVEADLEKGELASFSMTSPAWFLKIYIAYLRDYELPFAAKAFLDYLICYSNDGDLPVGVTGLTE